MALWELDQLPEIRAGDGFIVRHYSPAARAIRWFFSGWELPDANIYFHCWGNHIGWLEKPILKDDGSYLGINTVESCARGQLPGEFYDLYKNSEIMIVQTDLTDREAELALYLAKCSGHKPYDWLLPVALVKRYGLIKRKYKDVQSVSELLKQRLGGFRIDIPHIYDGRDVCVEFFQEPHADRILHKPLCNDMFLLVPDASGSIYWKVKFIATKEHVLREENDQMVYLR
jgi:hypothetical protein